VLVLFSSYRWFPAFETLPVFDQENTALYQGQAFSGFVQQAPFTPFLTEHMYQNLRKLMPEFQKEAAKSIHYLMLPETV